MFEIYNATVNTRFLALTRYKEEVQLLEVNSDELALLNVCAKEALKDGNL